MIPSSDNFRGGYDSKMYVMKLRVSGKHMFPVQSSLTKL